MKHVKRFVIFIIALFVIIFLAGSIYLALHGKGILERELSKAFGRKVRINYLGLVPPGNIMARGIKIEGLGKIKSIFIAPSYPDLIFGSIAFNKISINSPEFNLERTPPPVSGFKSLPVLPSMDLLRKRSLKVGEKGPIRLIIRKLTVRKGKLTFIDQVIGPNGLKISLNDLKLDLINFYTVAYPGVSNFHLKANMPWREGKTKGTLSIDGWLNFAEKSMEAVLKIEDIDGIYLYPYYSNWVNLEKARIESAALNFSSVIHGLNNEIDAQCHLELTDIVRRPLKEGEGEEKASRITNAVLDIFKTMDQGKIVLDFPIKTKMNNPQFGFSHIRSAFEDKITKARGGSGFKPEHILKLPARLLEGGVRGATDLTKSVIGGTFAVGNELKKAVEDTFKREPPKE